MNYVIEICNDQCHFDATFSRVEPKDVHLLAVIFKHALTSPADLSVLFCVKKSTKQVYKYML